MVIEPWRGEVVHLVVHHNASLGADELSAPKEIHRRSKGNSVAERVDNIQVHGPMVVHTLTNRTQIRVVGKRQDRVGLDAVAQVGSMLLRKHCLDDVGEVVWHEGGVAQHAAVVEGKLPRLGHVVERLRVVGLQLESLQNVERHQRNHTTERGRSSSQFEVVVGGAHWRPHLPPVSTREGQHSARHIPRPCMTPGLPAR